ncbi:hypothetical protein JCM14469_21610 [Desulfatiferula olefinivorans]
MTTIPNLNIVIQQGDAVRESHNIKNQALDTAQHVAFQRLEDEDRKRTMVSQTEEAEKVLFNKEHSGDGKRRQENRSPRKKPDTEPADKAVDIDTPGRLLNTVA